MHVMSLSYLCIHLNQQFWCLGRIPSTSLEGIKWLSLPVSILDPHVVFIWLLCILSFPIITDFPLWKLTIFSYTINVSCWCYSLFWVLVCLVNCSMPFSIYFLCYLPAYMSAFSLKVIGSSIPNAFSHIYQTPVALLHGSPVYAVSLFFACIFLCVTIAAFMFAWFLDHIKVFVFLSCIYKPFWALCAPFIKYSFNLLYFSLYCTCLLLLIGSLCTLQHFLFLLLLIYSIVVIVLSHCVRVWIFHLPSQTVLSLSSISLPPCHLRFVQV